MRATFGVGIPLRALWEAPTVAQLAELLAEGVAPEDEDRFAVLLPLRTRGDRSPLFCVHPAGGMSSVYAGLLRHVDDRPVYGLQARGLGADEPLPQSLEEMAADYVEQIRSVQPSGPYHLLGWSLGATVAHAMAARLEQDGDEVAVLVSLDMAPLPDAPSGQARVVSQQDVLAELLSQVGADPADLGQGPLDAAEVLAVLERHGSALAWLEPEHIERLARVTTNSDQLQRDWQPVPFNGTVITFVATPEGEADRHLLGRAATGWRAYTAGRIETYPVACAHEEMTRPGPIGEIGRVLAERLEAYK